MTLPLSGLRIVTAAEQYPGPYATMILADLGAEVIIVERPGAGDPTRAFPSFHAALNRNKRSVALDLKSAEGCAGLRRLLGTADVFIEGFRPGTMTRLGFGPDDVSAINSQTVYVSITGFGQTGPNRLRAAHDISYQASAGLLHARVADRDTSAIDELALGDLSSGTFAVVGTLAALLARQQTGRGAHVDVSMTDGLVSWLTASLVPSLNDQPNPELGSAEPAYGLFACADGKLLSLSVAYEDWFWEPLCDLLDMSDVRELPRAARIRGRVALRDRLENALLQRTRDEWSGLLDAADIAWSPVLDIAEVQQDKHFRDRDLFHAVPLTDGTTLTCVAQPLMFDGARPGPTRGTPQLGEANRDLL
ncbi:CaiB/BaiF CoA transferase family protein [Rhodococcus qingshengii]|uniref:CaiB/BaiF CoA transferase family protein n=1 Tax=Rhodococcus qingshengii TaxID=334542 RepID=UPI001C20F828|nr:CaiB/BaiF CoA-transferase family protein [Rhodococcus qingshengii]QXC46481.1 CoA transferase [Rhodococcus qingshengii]